MEKKLMPAWLTYNLPKRDNSAEEYEDACAGDPAAGRFAVADGASESSFANVWAKLLVEGYVRPPDRDRKQENWLAPLRRQWSAAVDHRELDWYGEEKRERGAFATFLSLRIYTGPEGPTRRWKASSVGDSCVFQVRDDVLLASFPVGAPAEFGNRPALIGSRPVRTEVQRKVHRGDWKPGDTFLLMTDALAEWFLVRNEAKRKPWQSLCYRLMRKNGAAELTAYLEQLRDHKELKNDDVTLGIVGPLP